MIKENLSFYNKKGNNLNLFFDPVNNIYRGNFTIGNNNSTSPGFIESEQIIITERVYIEDTGNIEHIKLLNSTINATFTNDDGFFFYDIYRENSDFFINKFEETQIDTDTLTTTIENVNGTDFTQIPSGNDIRELKKNFPVLNIGFSSDIPNSYIGTLNLYLDNELIANIFFYVDVVREDPKLPIILNNLGQTINNKDYLIFDTTDIKESEIDVNIINKKRKELLLEFHNIFPFLGSYKALINIIKFFGYESLTVKEYWKNVDLNSEKFGKTRGFDIEEIFDTGNTNVDELNDLIPSKIFRKTNTFGLCYQINRESGQFDEDGCPIVEDVFQFTIEEILIKLFALKEKLKQYFLPFNSRIIDIVGEALYYNKIDLNYWRDLTRIDSVDINIEVTFEGDNYGFIQDLRPLQWIGTKIGNDLLLDGTTDLIIREFEFIDTFRGNIITIFDSISNQNLIIEAEPNSDDISNIKALFDAIENSNLSMFNNYDIHINGNKILFIEKLFTNTDINITIDQGRFSSTQPTVNVVNFFNGDQPISNYCEAYIQYFYHNEFNVNELTNNEGIDVGFPLYLTNTSFDVTWDEATVTWNSLDPASTYNAFNLSTDTNFPTLVYNNGDDPNSGVSWNNIGNQEFYELEWIVSKEEDDSPAFRETISGDIIENKSVLFILPFTGSYTVELRMRDLFGSISNRIIKDFILVEQKNPDFVPWKIKNKNDLTWDELNAEWDQYGGTWDLPFLDNTNTNNALLNWQAIDNVEFYQQMLETDVIYKSVFDNNPYTWNNLTNNITWDEADHLYWDIMNPVFTKVFIKNINGNFTITARKEIDDTVETINYTPSGYSTNPYIDFIRLVNSLDSEKYPIFTSFIWDYTKLCYNNILEDTIIGVSKEISVPNRFIFTSDSNVEISEYNTEINGYGAIGDTPAAFYIYEINNSINTQSVISIDGISYTIPSIINDLRSLADELNNNSPYVDDWEFNPVIIDDNGTEILLKIIASKINYQNNDEVNVSYFQMNGTSFGRSVTTNATWSNIDVLYFQSDIQKGSKVYFSYEMSRMPGYTKPEWEIFDETRSESIIKYKNRFMSYLFTRTGEYTISLSLEDTNGNRKLVKKNGLIKVL